MRLESFRVRNYRSINDSGEIKASDRTVLVGRNESGKSNLLLALESLNPPGGIQPLNEVKDYPRDRPITDFLPTTIVLITTWRLTPEEGSRLSVLYPRAQHTPTVTVSRDYAGTIFVRVPHEPIGVDRSDVEEASGRIVKSAQAALARLAEAQRPSVKGALDRFRKDVLTEIDGVAKDWAIEATAAVDKLTSTLNGAGFTLPPTAAAALRKIRGQADDITKDDARYAKARAWVKGLIPTLIYVDDYPKLDGHQNLPAFLRRQEKGQEEAADREFERLMKVAGLDPETLNSLLGSDHERRQQLANRAGAVVTKALRDLWTDRKLKVRFNPDGEHFDTLISDSAAVYDVEINLNERSLGFRWFFSFYVAFTADTQGGDKQGAILLLDEPGLHLHAVAQRDLLRHFAQDFKNQIVFTTHSPFMIPVDDLDAIRTVNIETDEGTTVTNDPTGDSKTLFPLQAALGYDVTQTLFVGPANLVVEGVTDFWYLSSVAEYLEGEGVLSRPKGMVITPAGGAQKVSYMVALLTAQNVRVVVLLDNEKASRRSATEMIKERLIRNDSVLYVSEALADPSCEADIEDLLNLAVFDALVRESYATELSGITLSLDPHVPRIVKRYETAFEKVGLEFFKTRPARLFLAKFGEDPEAMLRDGGRDRFLALLTAAAERLAKQESSDRHAFL